MRQRVAFATTALLLASLVTAARAAFDARPPVAHTGGFGEPTCRECHFDGPSQPAGGLSLGGLPERYQPGAVYRLEVAIRDSTARSGGFQLAARVAGRPHAGTQAGTLCALDGRVAVATDSTSGVQYASHARAARGDSLQWQLEWRAPSTDVGAVVFHMAANSANDDQSALGDAILLLSRETRPETSGVRHQESGIRGFRVRAVGAMCEPFSSHPDPDTP